MSNKRHPHGRYDTQQLINAVRAATDNQMSPVKASRVYHIPESTIRSHIQNTSLRLGAGRKFYLSSKQERYLVELIKALESIGVHLTKIVLRKVVGEYIGCISSAPRFNREYAIFYVNTV